MRKGTERRGGGGGESTEAMEGGFIFRERGGTVSRTRAFARGQIAYRT
jgi:hypothetical protein